MTRATWTPFAASLAACLAAAAVLWDAPAAASPQAAAVTPTTYREIIPGTLVGFDMVLVPGGAGVTPFYLGRTEATWDMYDVFALGLDAKASPDHDANASVDIDRQAARGEADAVARPSRPYGAPDYGWGHAGYPAISIASQGAEAFASWLSAKTGTVYRLPTEAEWEHAAALAARGAGQANLDATAWHAGNGGGRTHPVASRAPDALGLFDLFGNAAEWVVTADGTAVARGGSFRDPLDAIGPPARVVQDDSWNARDPQLPPSRWWLSDAPFVGFRLARSADR